MSHASPLRRYLSNVDMSSSLIAVSPVSPSLSTAAPAAAATVLYLKSLFTITVVLYTTEKQILKT